MKKIYFRGVITSLILMAVFLITSTVYAGDASVGSMNIDAYIQEDGSMEINQNVVFNIDGNLNGVYVDILTNGKNGNFAEECEFTNVTVDGQTFVYSNQTANLGDTGVYNIERIANGSRIKIFIPSSRQARSVDISYILTNVVDVNEDIAQLYWNYIGTDWANSLQNVKLTVHLPVESEELRIWGHGPLNGSSKIIDKSTVEFYIDYIPAHTAVDARMVFDSAVVPFSTKYQKDLILEEVISKETVLANQANEQRENEQKQTNIVTVICYLVMLYFLVTFIFLIISIKKIKKDISKEKINFYGEYYRELPEDYGPAVVNQLLEKGSINCLKLLSTLLDLVRRKYIAIEEVKKTFSSDYKLTKLKDVNDSELKDYECWFMDRILFCDKDEILISELKHSNENYKVMQEKIEQCLIDVKLRYKEIPEHYKANEKKYKHISKNLGFNLLIGTVFFIWGYNGEFFSIVFPILFFCILGMVIWWYNIDSKVVNSMKTTSKGKEHIAMWNAFRKFLKDYSRLDEHPLESIVIWEHYLVYATALGISKNVIKQLRKMCPNIEPQDMGYDSNMTIANLCMSQAAFDSFSRNFASATGTAVSSDSNFSSGSGGGGGFSSSGGGGRRWRWRRWLLKSDKIYSNKEWLCKGRSL